MIWRSTGFEFYKQNSEQILRFLHLDPHKQFPYTGFVILHSVSIIRKNSIRKITTCETNAGLGGRFKKEKSLEKLTGDDKNTNCRCWVYYPTRRDSSRYFQTNRFRKYRTAEREITKSTCPNPITITSFVLPLTNDGWDK